MSMMGDHSEAPVSDVVEPDAEGSKEALPPVSPDPDSHNSHSAATVKLRLPPDFDPDSPYLHSAPTVTLIPPGSGTDRHGDDQ